MVTIKRHINLTVTGMWILNITVKVYFLKRSSEIQTKLQGCPKNKCLTAVLKVVYRQFTKVKLELHY